MPAAISFQINGERIRVEAPRNCNALSCIKIIAPGYSGTLGNIDLKGMGSKNKDDDDVADTTPAKPRRPRARAGPGHRAAARCARSGSTYTPAPAQTVASNAPVQADVAPPLPLRRLHPSPLRPRRSRRRLPQRPCPIRPRRSASGRPKRTRATCASRSAAPISAAIRQERRKDPDQHEAARQQVDRPDPRSRQRPQLRLDDRDEGHRSLKVQGCAFGGMFCGGQTWKRVS